MLTEREKAIRDRILSAKEELAYSDASLCEALGIQRNSINEWRSEKSKTFMKHIPALSEYFGFPIDYFYGNLDVYFPVGGGKPIYKRKEPPDNGQPVLHDAKNDVIEDQPEAERLLRLRADSALTQRIQEVAREVYQQAGDRGSEG